LSAGQTVLKIETLEGKGGQMIFLKGSSKAKQCRRRKVLGSAIFTHTEYHSKVCSRHFKNYKHIAAQHKRTLLAFTQYAF